MRRKRRMRVPLLSCLALWGNSATGISFTKLCRFKRSSRSPRERARPASSSAAVISSAAHVDQLRDTLCLGQLVYICRNPCIIEPKYFGSSRQKTIAFSACQRIAASAASRIRSVCSEAFSCECLQSGWPPCVVGLPPSPALYLILRPQKWYSPSPKSQAHGRHAGLDCEFCGGWNPAIIAGHLPRAARSRSRSTLRARRPIQGECSEEPPGFASQADAPIDSGCSQEVVLDPLASEDRLCSARLRQALMLPAACPP